MIADINFISAEAKALPHERALALVGSFSLMGTHTDSR